MILGMATATVYGRRMRAIRAEMGFGGRRQMAAFAREIGVEPPTVHDIESGKTKKPSLETAWKLEKKGVNPDYLKRGRQPVLLKFGTEEEMRLQEAVNLLRAMSPESQKSALELLKTIRRAQGDGLEESDRDNK